MSVIAGYLLPHPPLIFPEVGRGKQEEIGATVAAYRSAAAEIAAAVPDVVIIISPHTQTYADYFHISPGGGADGNMKNFGISGVKVHADYDAGFSAKLSEICISEGFPAGTQGEQDQSLDHGASIPVRFINEAFAQRSDAEPKRIGSGMESDTSEIGNGGHMPSRTPKYVRTGVSGLPLADHYRFGTLISMTAEMLGKRVVVVASGDLSHRLMDDGPYGYTQEGPEYDRIVCATCGDADFSRLFELDGAFCEKAGECGHRPLIVMAGALDRKAVKAKLLNYEGPFGVGYGVASFNVMGEDEKRDFLDIFLVNTKERTAERMKNESPHVALARATVENYVKTGRLYKIKEPLPSELTDARAGVFVSIKKYGELRGCIGTISPVTENVGEEIRANAVSAATRDPRFDAIGDDELPLLEYSVDVLAPAEPVDSEDALDPARYGVIVSLGGKRGLLLPDLEGIDDAEAQIGVAMRKAGIAERDRPRVKLERFEVIRHR